jgi:hypothetical protein
VGHASRSSDLLCMQAILGRVSQTGLNTGRGLTVGGVRGIIVEVVSESS